MARHLRITCPHCQRTGLRIPPELIGRKVECKHCGKIFRSEATEVDPDAPSRVSEDSPAPGPTSGGDGTSRRRDWTRPEDAEGAKTGPNSGELARIQELEDRLRQLKARYDSSRARLKSETAGRTADRDLAAEERARLEGEAASARAEADRLRAELGAARGEVGAAAAG